MEPKLLLFNNEEFGNVRTIQEDGKILFCAKDVASALQYKDTINAIKQHCRWVVKHHLPHPQAPDKLLEMSFIPEGDVYRLIVGSKLPSAERFERWLFDTVVPSIRKHGAYMTESTLQRVMEHPELIVAMAELYSRYNPKRSITMPM